MIEISRPTLIINEAQARANIQAIVEKAARHKLLFRPHFKTHQSHQVGQWYREMGVNRITVSSVVMAHYFAEDGWEDILIAFPYNFLEAPEIDRLAKKVNVGILIESEEALEHATAYIKSPIHYHIAIDIGYHRTGVSWEDYELVDTLMNQSSHHLFAGLVTHAGHTYDARGRVQVEHVHRQSLVNLDSLLQRIGPVFVSYGDTPSCSVSEYWEEVNELRCGNMVYYDLTQLTIGSCYQDQISVAVACPVVAKHPDRNQLVVYGGGVHFSKERLDLDNEIIFGLGVYFHERSWEVLPQVEMISLSQEHGKVSAPKSFIETCQIGDIIGFLPVHSCMSADLLSQQQTLEGVPIQKMMIK